MKVKIGGIKEISLVDVLNYPSFVVWFSFCNFRCPWCQNAPLVRGEGTWVEVDEIIKRFEESKDFVDYFHVTGGEPTVQGEALIELLEKARKIKKVSINTNSYNYKIIRKLKLDHVAADFKAPPEKYERVVGIKVDFENIIKSFEYYKKNVPFIEIRTTFIPTLLEPEDIFKIAKFIKDFFEDYEGRLAYVLQQFLPADTIENEFFRKLKPPSEEFLLEMAKKIDLPEVWVRTSQGIRRVIRRNDL